MSSERREGRVVRWIRGLFAPSAAVVQSSVRSPTAKVRVAALRDLRRFLPEQWAETALVTAATKDKSDAVRVEASIVLASIRHPDAVQALVHAFRTTIYKSYLVDQTLIELGTDAIPALREIADDPRAARLLHRIEAGEKGSRFHTFSSDQDVPKARGPRCEKCVENRRDPASASASASASEWLVYERLAMRFTDDRGRVTGETHDRHFYCPGCKSAIEQAAAVGIAKVVELALNRSLGAEERSKLIGELGRELNRSGGLGLMRIVADGAAGRLQTIGRFGGYGLSDLDWDWNGIGRWQR